MSFGFGFGFTKITAAIRAAFSPSSLFAANEPGVWYDPSDLSTMFQDAAGTSPVTTVEQPVGLMLDKSKGVVLGPELVTNGTFGTGTTGWSAGGGASIARSTAVFPDGGLLVTANGGAASYGSQAVDGLTAGKRYVLSARVYSPSTNAANNRATIGIQASPFTSAGSIAQLATDQIQTISIQFIASGTNQTIYCSVVTSNFLAFGTNGSVAHFDNISVREIPGNHAYQTTATSRPVLSARVNLLTKTEQFDDAVWTKQNCNSTANTLTENSGPNRRFGMFFITDITSSSSHTFSVAVKNFSGTRFARIVLNTALSNVFACVDVNPQTGTIAQTLNSGLSGIESSSTDLGNGWHRVSITATGEVKYVTVVLITGSTVPAGTDFGYQAYTGDGTSGIYVWGADLRVANAGTNLPPYQRVNTATDYDTAGFPHYLYFDGVDDWLVTNTITPGIDKAQVFAGVRKLRDSPVGSIAELSVDAGKNAGGFIMRAPQIGATYAYFSRGDASLSSAVSGTTFVAPITNVLTGLGDISGDRATLHINGVQAAQNTADQGTGNYLAYPLYIGCRGGTTLRFNGNLYSLIVRFGSNLPIETIEKTEKYVNTKTRAY